MGSGLIGHPADPLGEQSANHTYIYVYISLCGYLVCGCLGPPGSAAGVTSMRKWLKIRSFTLVEIVIFQNLFLSSRGWKNQLVEIFCGMESSKKKKKQKPNKREQKHLIQQT